MAITTKDYQDFDVQILQDAIRGVFKMKNAFMGSTLVSQGAVRVSGTMPKGPRSVGEKIDVPYFGVIGEFVANSDGNSVTPVTIKQTREQATIDRDSLAIEVSAWAQGMGAVDPALGDPYQEGTNQLRDAAVRAMDAAIIAKCAATPLIKALYSATVPVYIDWDTVIDAKTLWGDDQSGIVAMVTHSQTLADMAKLKDSSGRPLLLMDQTLGNESVVKFAGVPLVISDRTPLTGSTMGTNTATGTSPPVLTLAGTPTGPWDLVIECQVGGAHETATIRFSTDGGNTWSADLVTAAAGVALPLIDTAADSLVGNSGKTGITAAFAAGTFNADNKWVSKANLKVTTMILQQDAAAFWFNSSLLELLTDKDILAHTDIAAMHLYRAAHLYRRRRGGTRPGCVAITHNVRGFIG